MRSRFPILSAMAGIILAACGDPGIALHPAVDAGSALATKTPPPTSVPVTSTIDDHDGSGNPLLMGSDDFNASGFATYTSTSGHGTSLTSRLTTNGGWQLLLNGQTARTIHLILASQGISGIPDGYYSNSVEVFARCFDANNVQVSLLQMTAGASNGNCTFGVDFGIGRTIYKLALGPDFDAAAPTGRALVTCTSSANGECASWTVEPNPATMTTFALTNGQFVSAPAANLYAGSAGFQGSYHNSFFVRVAK